MNEKPESATEFAQHSETGEPRRASETAGKSDALTVLDQIGEINSRLSRLESLLSTSDRGDGNAVLRELHAQLQEARMDLHWKVLRPVLLDLVKLHDEMTQATKSLDPSRDSALRNSELLTGFAQDVLDTLYRQGFSPYTVEDERFDARRQQPVNTLPAPSVDLAGTIVCRVAVGFASEQRVLRPEKVIVYGPSRSPAASGHPSVHN